MVTNVYQYDPYGQVTYGGEERENFYAYNGESYNPNFRLVYLRARYYNANQGRFFQEDTYLGDITDPLTLNRYAYVKNSPLNYVDPSGHAIDTIFDVVSWLVRAAEFVADPFPATALSLAWDSFAVLAPGIPSVGLMDDAAEFVIKETGEHISKKVIKEAAEEAAEQVAKEGLQEATQEAAEKEIQEFCEEGAEKAVQKGSQIFLPDEAYNKQLPKFVTPGTKNFQSMMKLATSLARGAMECSISHCRIQN